MDHITKRLLVSVGTAGTALVATATMIGFSASAGSAIHAQAAIVDSSGNTIGLAKFTEDAAGVVHVNVTVAGLTPGLHGTHVHAVGRCDGPAFTTAGGHFDPGTDPHGAHTHGPHAEHHAGDLPNLKVTPAAQGKVTSATAHFSLSGDDTLGLFDADGSSIVIHAAADDLATQPSGNSGARLACGVIEPA